MEQDPKTGISPAGSPDNSAKYALAAGSLRETWAPDVMGRGISVGGFHDGSNWTLPNEGRVGGGFFDLGAVISSVSQSADSTALVLSPPTAAVMAQF